VLRLTERPASRIENSRSAGFYWTTTIPTPVFPLARHACWRPRYQHEITFKGSHAYHFRIF
jgi:hypothetical protein